MQASTDTIHMDPDIWATMPDELLEKVLARLPLKSLFQTRVLSKSWGAKLCSSSFQAEVSKFATKWDSYCVVYICNEGLIGYNAASKCCERVLTLSYLPYHGARLVPGSRGNLSACGPLLSFVDLNFQSPSIYVTNVITKAWKVLPPSSNMSYPAIIHVFLIGGDAYKVLVINPRATPCAQIYDSATRSWSIRISESATEASTQLRPATSRWANALNSFSTVWTDSTYFQNTLYVLWGNRHCGPFELLAYNVNEESWTKIRINDLRAHTKSSFSTPMSRILVCGDKVMIVVRLIVEFIHLGFRSSEPILLQKNRLLVFELLPDTEQIVEVTTGPPLELLGTDLNQVACDDSCIYVYERLASLSPVAVYNIKQQEWSYLPSIFHTQTFRNASKNITAPEFFLQPVTSSFQPGLNPFIAI